MFTVEQIKAAHSKVKSGADFPAYIQEIKALGLLIMKHMLPINILIIKVLMIIQQQCSQSTNP